MKHRPKPITPWHYLAWLTVVLSVGGSLYFSEIRDLTPCLLCWWQRILMYPLAIILTVGIVRRQSGLPYLVLPFTVLGSLVATYHYLLQQGVLPEAASKCQIGISCTDVQVEYLGFITIPFMALIAFLVISAAMIIILRKERR